VSQVACKARAAGDDDLVHVVLSRSAKDGRHNIEGESDPDEFALFFSPIEGGG
jgi:hypothetical protein